MPFAMVLHGCTCAGVRTRNERRLECSCLMLALSYNIWRRGWDNFVLYDYFVLFPTPYDLTSLRFVRLCFCARARGCVCKSHHGFTVARRGWDNFVLYDYFVLFPTPYDLTSLRFVRLCFCARARGCVCKSHHGFTVARFCW